MKWPLRMQQVRNATKSLVVGIVAASGFLNVPPIYDFTLRGLAHMQRHPHVSVLAAGTVAVLALLHDPRVQEALKNAVVVERKTTVIESATVSNIQTKE